MMDSMGRKIPLSIVAFTIVLSHPAQAADDGPDVMMKAVAMDAGRISPAERKLYEESIRSTKKNIARETLDVFYRDALDFYRQGRYEEAQEWLEKIYSIDPYYEDVATLRQTISLLKTSHDIESKRGILEDYMRKGNQAQQAGQNVQAVKYWKQALTVNASYEPAKKKIAQVNHALAQKQYEAGYLYYHHGDLAEALDSWSNAIAMDPSFKQRGLLLLMSKAELALRRDRAGKLATQGSQQYAQKDLRGALQSYEELLTIDPRNEEARRMAAKIKIQLGQAAYKAARESLSQDMYAQAIKQWQESIRYGYEVQRAQRGIQEAENLVQRERAAKAAPAKKPAKDPEDQQAAQAPPPPAAPPPVINAKEAEAHYREGLAAIRNKDFHRALSELEIASQLNPNDEHIYVARERARQEWNSANAARTAQPQ
jgi:tetratricopeptide (TPR) repeat protein